MAREFAACEIPHQREVDLAISYKGDLLDCCYRVDFVCFGSVVVEIKALKRIGGIEESQIINYLKATGYERGILLNFGATSLEYRRLVRSAKASTVLLDTANLRNLRNLRKG